MPSGWCGRPSEPVAVHVRSPLAVKSDDVAEKLKRGVLNGAVFGAVMDHVASVLLHCVTETLAGSRPRVRAAMVSISRSCEPRRRVRRESRRREVFTATGLHTSAKPPVAAAGREPRERRGS